MMYMPVGAHFLASVWDCVHLEIYLPRRMNAVAGRKEMRPIATSMSGEIYERR